MTREEHAALINNIRTAQSEVERNTHLAALAADYTTVLDTQAETAIKMQQLEKDNTEYAKLNNNLFLQLGTQQQQQQQQTVTQQQQEPIPPKRNFEDLKFD